MAESGCPAYFARMSPLQRALSESSEMLRALPAFEEPLARAAEMILRKLSGMDFNEKVMLDTNIVMRKSHGQPSEGVIGDPALTTVTKYAG